MFAWLIVAVALLTFIAGFLLQHFWPSWESRQHGIGARCILFGGVVGLFALGWVLYQPFGPNVMPKILFVALAIFVIGFFAEMARGMAAAPSMYSDWGLYFVMSGSVAGLFALGWCVHGWILRWAT